MSYCILSKKGYNVEVISNTLVAGHKPKTFMLQPSATYEKKSGKAR